VLVLVGAMTSPAIAEDVALEYESAGTCPDRLAFEVMVTERLGYSPFDVDAEKSAVVTLRGQRARVRIVANGETVGDRRLEGGDCAELAAATALALAIAIDANAVYSPHAHAARAPEGAGESESEPEPGPGSGTEPEPEPDALRVAAVEPEHEHGHGHEDGRGTRVYVGAGLVGVVGASPDPTAGATLQLGMQRGRVSLDLEGRVDRSSHVEFGTGRVHASLTFAALIPCYRRGRFAGCGVLALGALRGRGEDFVEAASVTSTFAAGGARVAWEVPVADRVSARLHADLLGAFARTSLQVSGMDVWTLPPVSGAVGFSAVGHFE